MAAQSKQAVVSIFAKTRTPVRVRLIPLPIPGLGLRVRLPGVGLGSGFFVHPSGILLTNNHVIRHASEIRALTADGEELAVRVLARDPAFDLALLEVVDASKQFMCGLTIRGQDNTRQSAPLRFFDHLCDRPR